MFSQEIIGSYREHMDAVTIELTQAFQEEMLLRELKPGKKPTWDVGERAAVEVVRNYPLAGNGRSLLLGDDRDVERLLVFEPDRTILLTIWDYLRQLEEAQRIQSAELVMETVRQAERNPPLRDLWSDHDPEVRDAVREVIERAHREHGLDK